MKRRSEIQSLVMPMPDDDAVKVVVDSSAYDQLLLPVEREKHKYG